MRDTPTGLPPASHPRTAVLKYMSQVRVTDSTIGFVKACMDTLKEVPMDHCLQWASWLGSLPAAGVTWLFKKCCSCCKARCAW